MSILLMLDLFTNAKNGVCNSFLVSPKSITDYTQDIAFTSRTFFYCHTEKKIPHSCIMFADKLST